MCSNSRTGFFDLDAKNEKEIQFNREIEKLGFSYSNNGKQSHLLSGREQIEAYNLICYIYSKNNQDVSNRD